MIAAQLSGSPTPADRWAYGTLLDLARLLPAAHSAESTVSARVFPGDTEFEVSQGELRIGRAVVDQVVAIAGAGAEQETRERDRHGRVPSSANPLVQDGTSRTLPMQALAIRMTAAADQASERPLPRIAPWPEGRPWAAAITHDVDVVSGWPLFAALRWAELLRKGKIGPAVSAIGSALGSVMGNPVRSAIDQMIAIEAASGVRATWFVLAGEPSLSSWRRGDVTYRLDGKPARALLERMMLAAHEVGLHGSLDTAESADRMRRERDLVGRVTGTAPAGIRQHFLRTAPGITPGHAQAAGFGYDSSFGFADRSGFRLGTADVVQGWNAASAAPLDLLEAPLAWMDRTFSKYQGIEDPERWVDDALDLAGICKASGGLWVGLWHPNVVPALGYPGTWPAFERLIQSLVKMDAYIAPLGELVAWRRARRGLRGSRQGDGRLTLTGAEPGVWGVSITEGTRTTRHPWPAVQCG